jgi:hypothetical protein
MIPWSYETIETWIVYVCHSEGELVIQNIELSAVFFPTVPHVYQERSTTQNTSSQLDSTVGSIGVNMGQHPCGTLSTPCRDYGATN